MDGEIIRSIKGMVRKVDGAMRLVDLNDVIAVSISGLYSPTRLGHVAQSHERYTIAAGLCYLPRPRTGGINDDQGTCDARVRNPP